MMFNGFLELKASSQHFLRISTLFLHIVFTSTMPFIFIEHIAYV